MESIFSFFDYREYLHQVYESRKRENPLYSYRVMGNGMGIDASYLAKVMGKSLHLGPKQIPTAQNYLKLSGAQAEYFALLVQFCKAKQASTAQALYERLSAIRPIAYRSLAAEQYEVFRSWVHPALRSLLGFTRFTGSHRELGALLEPAVASATVKDSLRLLAHTGLIQQDASGDYHPTHPHMGTNSLQRNLAAREFQRQASQLQSEALERFPPAERDISTLTVAADSQALADIREIIRNCRRAIQKRVDECPSPERVYQINLAVFPFSKTTPPENRKDTP